ncbi:MAG: LysR family transcriptional regulator [Candidatus Dactylopiibacterium carminicum]|uniref:LysR family transcriptional regulator n=1 Tax=Candidatus Dactylopiibacterium carminicum TaxID=857335 RepID=A0A272ES00_9RHOO|nr:LysR family transcriptional regulator [Candidatus Dactylopiibacterium carminicum]KAF7598912.1 LysR family transcriptional regulator [Candidatus Dactylopiibacterium carminicum]PAS92888.1 MAG: LysR family transcriptional regulator [Candidatus Dactylopiibacterium carminicum]PAS96466.1 MAG: LysR family transcriptional regulator [Candidatus Dactylopiibacterium carminicum]PAS98930.1 MAG: LysR family transcriptional regulator [Candidatus Dactylopiibacterium carminicum]
MSLNLRQIEVFRAVMITGSISGASQLLFVSQPAVSRLLSHTESRIGFALFERIKGRLYATPEAKKLFREVEQVYAGVQRVNELARELEEHSEGILNVISSPSLGQMVIPQAMAAFREHHPQIKLGFQYLGLSPLVERLLNHQADLGVTIVPVDHPNLECSPLGSGRLVCICPPGHALARHALLGATDLLAHPLIAYDRSSPFGLLVTGLFEQVGESYRTAIEVGSPQNACALVMAGAGIAVVDEFSVRSWPENQLVVRPLQDAPSLQANLVHTRFEPLSQTAQTFVTVLRRFMQGTECPAQRQPDLPEMA